MTTYCLFIIMFICCLNNAFGKIINGYETEINSARESLKHLNRFLQDNRTLPRYKALKIKDNLNIVIRFISYYELTEQMLAQFNVIAPDLYNEINTITDKKGRPVNVYVKFVPLDATKHKSWGTTYFNQGEDDKDVNFSEYGEHTVSVKIWVVSKALLVLSHELGHVKYQVANLASYVDYFKKHYSVDVDEYESIGHCASDPSGKNAREYVNRFRERYTAFRRTKDKVGTPLTLLENITHRLVQNNKRDESELNNKRDESELTVYRTP
jgi:hypothetical protein